MLTGVTTPEMAAAIPASDQPTAVARDAKELAAVLEKLA
jgi:hypothetical protein